MSEVRLIIRDAWRKIHATRHGSFADAVVAALAAEPETIEELDAALERFRKRGEGSFFRHFTAGADDEPYDAGLVVIDLAARLVVCDSTYSTATANGVVPYHDGNSATDVPLRYRLCDDWHLTSTALGWRSLAERRRAERAANPPIDVRAVLYGRPLLEFIASQCLAASGGATVNDVVRDVHARWLLTPRDDLRGQSPREVMLAKRDFIGWDLQHRAEQWSMLGSCPRGLDPQSQAFRLAGFGTHELVEYYELVRLLLGLCLQRLTNQPAPSSTDEYLATEVERLERLRDEWLATPDPESQGLTPWEVIDHERARLPEGVTGHKHAIDHDCPLCEMLAEMPGPMFWHLCSSNMDDDFAFSFHRTLEEWEKEQRDREEFNRRFQAEWQERTQLGMNDSDSVWKRSYAAPDSEEMPVGMRLVGIGSLLAELIVDLKEPTEDRPRIERLQRDFGNLREVVGGNDALTEALLAPVVERFAETLVSVASVRADLEPKCSDLEGRLRRFLGPSPAIGPLGDDFDDLPY